MLPHSTASHLIFLLMGMLLIPSRVLGSTCDQKEGLREVLMGAHGETRILLTPDKAMARMKALGIGFSRIEGTETFIILPDREGPTLSRLASVLKERDGVELSFNAEELRSLNARAVYNPQRRRVTLPFEELFRDPSEGLTHSAAHEIRHAITDSLIEQGKEYDFFGGFTSLEGIPLSPELLNTAYRQYASVDELPAHAKGLRVRASELRSAYPRLPAAERERLLLMIRNEAVRARAIATTAERLSRFIRMSLGKNPPQAGQLSAGLNAVRLVLADASGRKIPTLVFKDELITSAQFSLPLSTPELRKKFQLVQEAVLNGFKDETLTARAEDAYQALYKYMLLKLDRIRANAGALDRTFGELTDELSAPDVVTAPNLDRIRQLSSDAYWRTHSRRSLLPSQEE